MTPTESLRGLVTLPGTQEKTFSTEGATTKTPGHGQAVQREEGPPDFAARVTPARKTPPRSPAAEAHPRSTHFLNGSTRSVPPPGELRPWLCTPLQDKAEQSYFSRLPLFIKIGSGEVRKARTVTFKNEGRTRRKSHSCRHVAPATNSCTFLPCLGNPLSRRFT